MTASDIRQVYIDSDALELGRLVRTGQVTASELAETAIGLIEEINPRLNAVVIKTYDIGREAASNPSDGPFAGVPFLLKNIGSEWKSTPLTNGHSYLRDNVCTADSELSRRIRQSGFLLLGRTNTPEGGWSIGTEPNLYGPTANPWNAALSPGGSSGGAAAAVAARILPLAEASDGGGSIRAPASCCGLVGLKPSRGRITYGRQSADIWHGSVATFCVTRTVRDTAAYLDAVAGSLPGDPYHAPRQPGSWLDQLDRGAERLRIAYTLKQPWGEPFAPEVRQALVNTLALLEGLGHEILEYDLTPDLRSVWNDYNVINAVETAAEFERLATAVGRKVRQDDLAAFNWSMLEFGRSLSAVQYADSIACVRNVAAQIAMELAPYDVFLTPTLTQPPRPIGYWSMEESDIPTYLDRWADAGHLFAFNISGLPAMSVPVVIADENIPIGMQLVGRHGDELTLLQLAQKMEQVIQWHEKRPARTDCLVAG